MYMYYKIHKFHALELQIKMDVFVLLSFVMLLKKVARKQACFLTTA